MTSSYGITLSQKWRKLRENDPKLRIRDAARELGVSEAELVALGNGDSSFQLQSRWDEILSSLKSAGQLMGLTRNEHAVHECYGSYEELTFCNEVCFVENDRFRVALFLSEWSFGFFVKESNRGEIRQSLQFFNQDGDAVHKIYMTSDSQGDPLEYLVRDFALSEQSPSITVGGHQSTSRRRRPGTLWSSDRINNGWAIKGGHHSIQQTHLELEELNSSARSLHPENVDGLLHESAEKGFRLVVAVESPGALQIYDGPIQKIARTGPWINILDDTFNLHLRDARLPSLWLIAEQHPRHDRSPSLCWFDDKNQLSMQFFFNDRIQWIEDQGGAK